MSDDQLTPAGDPQESAPVNADQPAEQPAQTAPEPVVEPAVESTEAPVELPTAEEATVEAPEVVETPDVAAEAVAAAPEAPEVSASDEPPPSREEEAALFEAEFERLSQIEEGADSSSRRLTRGDRIEATVIQVERDRVFVDLGMKSEGVVPLNELSRENLESAHDSVSVGDKIQVVVLKTDSAEGNPIVSKVRADFEVAWDRIIEAFNDERILNSQVLERVKGGLVVDVGVRGFVPATHVGNGKLRNIEKYVGQSIPLKVIEIDRERKKVVLSNRMAEEEKREQVKGEIFSRTQPGDVLEGTVRRLTDYGAFVDLGGIDGLLHISEMSWMRITHPKEVLKEGQKIQVMVLRLDPNVGKISLGLRQVLPDPWNLIKENYRIGQKVQCKISRIVQSGAFIRLPEGAEAFLPASEVSNRRNLRPSDVLEENQDVELTIIDLRPDERRMVLSLRSGGGGGYDEPRTTGGSYEPGGFDDDRPRKPGVAGAKKKGTKTKGRGGRHGDDDYDGPIVGRVPTGGATIGERLGMLKGFTFRTEDEDETAEPEAEAEAEVEVPAETETTDEA